MIASKWVHLSENRRLPQKTPIIEQKGYNTDGLRVAANLNAIQLEW